MDNLFGVTQEQIPEIEAKQKLLSDLNGGSGCSVEEFLKLRPGSKVTCDSKINNPLFVTPGEIYEIAEISPYKGDGMLWALTAPLWQGHKNRAAFEPFSTKIVSL